MIPYQWFVQAQERIAPYIVETPLTLDAERGLFIKWENRQMTGSFKARGALNKVLALENWERKSGLVAASAGNHGQGVALAAQLTGSNVDVFVPAHAVTSKVEAMRNLGAQVHFVEGGYAEAETAAREFARERHKEYISPYNDGLVIAGQGSVALEIVRQLPQVGDAVSVDAKRSSSRIANWIVPTGGGGLIAACGAVLANLELNPKLIGVQPAASAFTHSLYHRHTQEGVDDNPTLADGLSGAIEEDSVTIPMLEQYVEDVVVVSEEAIARAIAFASAIYHEKIEGSAAVALAAVREGLVPERPSVVIITGGNIESDVYEGILARYAGQPWD